MDASRGSAVAQDERSEPVTATDDLSSQRFYHGTRADLKPGDLIEAGRTSNYGKRNKTTYVYLTGTLDAAAWGAELASDEVIPLPGAAAGHGRSHRLAGALPRGDPGHEGRDQGS
jgi:hypothetical protein